MTLDEIDALPVAGAELYTHHFDRTPSPPLPRHEDWCPTMTTSSVVVDGYWKDLPPQPCRCGATGLRNAAFALFYDALR